jgi:general secretion pathway protein E
MARLNIAEKRIPQDGRMRIRMGGEDFDLRVSILPCAYGESINIRILNRKSMFLKLEDLGFEPADMSGLLSLVQRPHGIVLVTGPTGSGKTTTLYAVLNKLNALDRKIITIEDPIEYLLKGVMQMQVLNKVGFTFTTALRSILRHDPDVILVGEIRDYETAEIAIRAALTGHLVFSTLHTNDSAGAITRLLDMGVEPFLIASSINGVMAQRLIRIICEDCKKSYSPDVNTLNSLGLGEKEIKNISNIYTGAGCARCRNTGYRGRTVISEVLPIDDQIQTLIMKKETASVIKKKARSKGMNTLRECGWRKVTSGVSTAEELLRVTQEDRESPLSH